MAIKFRDSDKSDAPKTTSEKSPEKAKTSDQSELKIDAPSVEPGVKPTRGKKKAFR